MRGKISRKFTLGLGVSTITMIAAGPALADHVKTADLQKDYSFSNSEEAPMGASTSSAAYIMIHNLPNCYAGTLGAELVGASSGARYILSNNHVLAKENEALDDPSDADNATIIEAGLMDAGNCTVKATGGLLNSHYIASLSRYVQIDIKKRNPQTSFVDAAIANEGNYTSRTSSQILGLGDLDTQPYLPAIGQIVQKVGRTTGHTMGVITTMQNSLKVSYSSGTAIFNDQYGIQDPCGGSFSDAGDSGSLITLVPGDDKANYNDQPAYHAAVGLLFAGDSTYTWANDINEVLAELNGTSTKISTPFNNDPVAFVIGDKYSGPTLTLG